MIKNKKGISAIVATVLIILITVAAVTIIWAAVIPLVSDQIDKSSACLDANKEISIGPSYTCWDEANSLLKVQVRMGPNDVGINELRFFASDNNGNTYPLTDPDYSFTSTLPTVVPGINEAKVYEIDNSTGTWDKPASISVAATVPLGNSEQLCDVAQTMTNIPNCL